MTALQVFDVSPRGYSQSVAIDLSHVSRLVFVSGQVALDASGAVVGEGDFEKQCRHVFAQLEQQLAEAGARLADVAKLTIFVRDFSQFATLARVRHELFPAGAPPASTAVAISELVDPRLLIEVEAVAAVPAAG
jgi:enamine deaminase RidA (YjgF/YER057c/UK114 family)